MAEQFPRQFGKYLLLKSLARGGMGEIYLAASGQPGGFSKLCVIKKVITEKTEAAKVNRFLDEAKVVLRLSHANLVSTFDAGDVAGELYIAMELVEGKDLREIWNRCVRTRTRIPVDVALVVVREIARALSYVHAYGGLRLVHRDVAPPNILLSYFGEVKLTDFGLARSTLKQEHTAPGVVFGRASYLAPEQARGEVADGRTDVYSLGIVLWELLTGQPYLQLAGLDPVTSLSLVRNPKTEPPSTRAPWIVPELDAVVLKALAADRAARYQSAEEMRRELAEVMMRVAPRADDERVAEFLRGLYGDVVQEESVERDRLLSETVPRFRGEELSEQLTPLTDVIPVEAADLAVPAADAVSSAGAGVAPGGDVAAAGPDLAPLEPRASGDDAPAAAVALAVPEPSSVPVADGAGAPLGSTAQGDVGGGGAAPSATGTDDAAGSAAGSGLRTGGRGREAPKESLARSAMRARAGSQGRRPAKESSGAEATTKVWRKKEGIQRDDAIGAQTFVGRVIDSRYRVLNRIGEGGMGTVYAAEHVEIGKKVAVKILHRIFSGEEQLVERFRREARAASKVGHPHIIDVNDFGTTEEGCAYFVMELLEGLDLADVLVNDGHLDPARAVRIAIQICQALEAAHTAGIIHRDLKPENVFLVARDGQADFAKVLDFGIARNLFGESQRLTNPGMAMGTPEYMAPEQAVGKPADRRTDIYAVGALLHEMVMGVAPFKADLPQVMLEAKRRPLKSLRQSRPDLPPALDAIILKTLAPDPDKRPQTMTQLEYELAKIAWGRPQAVADLLGLRPTPSRTMDVVDPSSVPDPLPPLASEGRSATPSGKGEGGGGAPRGTVRTRTKSNARTGSRAGPASRAAAKARAAREVAAEAPGLTRPSVEDKTNGSVPPPVDRALSMPTPPPLLALPPIGAPDIEKMLEDLSPPPEVTAAAPPPVATFPLATPLPAPTLSPSAHLPAPQSPAPQLSASPPPASGPLPAPPPRLTPRRAPSLSGLEGVAPSTRLSSGHLLAVTAADAQAAPPADLRARRGPGVVIVALTMGLGGVLAYAGTHGGVEQVHSWLSGPRGNAPTVQAAAAGTRISGITARDRRPGAPIVRLVTEPPPDSADSVGSVGNVGNNAAPAAVVVPASAPPSAATRAQIVAPGAPPPTAAPRTAPEIVLTPVIDRARTAIAEGAPDDAVAVLRPAVAAGNAEAKPLLVDALVASGWKDVRVYRWGLVARKAREALTLTGAAAPSRGGHALLGEALYALGEFAPALGEFTKALSESPHDPKLKRRIIRSRRQLKGPASATPEAAAEEE